MADSSPETRRLSAAIFNNEKMAEVVVALDGNGDRAAATAQQLADRTDIKYGMVRDVLLRLVKSGLVVAVPKVGGSRASQYYQPMDSAGWSHLVDLATWVASSEGGAETVVGSSDNRAR